MHLKIDDRKTLLICNIFLIVQNLMMRLKIDGVLDHMKNS